MNLIKKPCLLIWGQNDKETPLDPYEFDSDKNDSDIEEYRFNLAGYYDFKITNVSQDINVLGVMEFWS